MVFVYVQIIVLLCCTHYNGDFDCLCDGLVDINNVICFIRLDANLSR